MNFAWDTYMKDHSKEEVDSICHSITSLQNLFNEKFQTIVEKAIAEGFAELAASTAETDGIDRLQHKVAAAFMRFLEDLGWDERTAMATGWLYAKHWLEKTFQKVQA